MDDARGRAPGHDVRCAGSDGGLLPPPKRTTIVVRRKRTDRGDMNDPSTVGPAGRRRQPEEQWHKLLTDGHGSLVRARHVFRYLPSAPRCKVCNNPFGGVAGHMLAAAGFRPSRKNPNLCTRCCDALPPGGTEVDIAVLFADVRGSTALGERTPAADFATLLDRFYAAATQTLLWRDAVIDKLIGDEVMAFFVRGISGPDYRHQAVRAGLELLSAVGYGMEVWSAIVLCLVLPWIVYLPICYAVPRHKVP